jgi:hypothetical protein
MTIHDYMLIVSILMVLGSFAWIGWDLRRRHLARKKELQRILDKIKKENT